MINNYFYFSFRTEVYGVNGKIITINLPFSLSWRKEWGLFLPLFCLNGEKLFFSFFLEVKFSLVFDMVDNDISPA